MDGRVKGALLVALAVLCGLLAGAPAQAQEGGTPSRWGCEAQALEASLLGFDLVEELGLLTANGDRLPCADDEAPLDDVNDALEGLRPVGIDLAAVEADTSIAPGDVPAAAQVAHARSNVAGLELSLLGITRLLEVEAAEATATGRCVDGGPSLTGTSNVGDVRVADRAIDLDLDQPVTIVGNLVNGLLPGMVVELTPNQQVVANGTLTRIALRVRVLNLGVQVLDLSVSRAIVTAAQMDCVLPGPAVELLDSGRNRGLAAAVTPGEHRTIASCSFTVTPAGGGEPRTLPGAYDPGTGRCTAGLPRDDFPLGSYHVLATATDDLGGVGSDEGTKAIQPPNLESPMVSGRDIVAGVTPRPGTTIASCSFAVTPQGGTATTVPGTYDAATNSCRGTIPDEVPEGPATATATATDDAGDSATTSASVTVGPRPAGPTVALVDSGVNRTVTADVTPGAAGMPTTCSIAARPAGSGAAFTPLSATLADGRCIATLPREGFPVGEYEVRAEATDPAGRTGMATGSKTVVAPEVGVIAVDGRVVSAPVTPPPGTAITACTVRFVPDGSEVQGAVADGACTATAPDTIGRGPVEVTVTARNGDGDTGSATATRELGPRGGSQPPVLQLVGGQPNRTAAASVDVASNRSVASCAATAVAAGSAQAPLAIPAAYDAPSGRCVAQLAPGTFAPGPYTVAFEAVDSEGESGTTAGTVVIRTPEVGTPQVADRLLVVPVTPAPGAAIATCALAITPEGGQAVALAGSHDAGAGVCRATVPAEVPDGPATVTATATDVNGDQDSATGSVTVGPDPSGPTVVLLPSGENRVVLADVTAGSGGPVASCKVEVRASGSGEPFAEVPATYQDGRCTAELPRAQVPVGTHDVRVTATDDDGRTGSATGTHVVSAPLVGTIAVDGRDVVVPVTPAPGTTITACSVTIDPAGDAAPVTVAGTWDAGRGVCVATAPGALQDGPVTLRAEVTDDNGDTGAGTGAGTLGQGAGGTPPTVTLVSGTANRVVAGEVDVAAGREVLACAISVVPDGGTAAIVVPASYDDATDRCVGTLPPGTVAPGAYTATVTATDSAGESGSASGPVVVRTPGVGAPQVDGGRTITVPVDVPAGTTIVACRFEIDPEGEGAPVTLNGTFDPATQRCRVQVPASVPDGPAQVTATAVDANGDRGTATGKVTIGAQPKPDPGDGGGGGTPQNQNPPGGGVAGQFTQGTANQQLLACANGRGLVLTDVRSTGSRTQLVGVAEPALAGRTVSLVFTATRQVVATATVGGDGSFSATAPLPPSRLRTSNAARYQAVVGGSASKRLKFSRRLLVTTLRASATHVRIAGRTTAPVARRGAAVTIQRLVACGRYETVRVVRASRTGRFNALLARPDARAAIYRVITSVPRSSRSRRTSRTYSLPTPIDFG